MGRQTSLKNSSHFYEFKNIYFYEKYVFAGKRQKL